MPLADKARRTEPPTPRRLRRAREQGEVARSAALSRALVLAAAVGLGGWAGARAAERLPSLARAAWSVPAAPEMTAVQVQGRAATEVIASLLGWPLVLLALFALLADLVQVGPVLAPSRLSPRLDRLSPAQGLRRMFSARSLAFLGLAAASALAVGWVTAGVLLAAGPELARSPGAGLQSQVALGADLLGSLAWRAAAVLVGFGALDWWVARRAHRQELFMTPEEVRREQREREGDPAIRGKRRELGKELAGRDPVAACREADLLVCGDGRVAALCYRPPEDRAPRIAAASAGEEARRVLQAASRAGTRRIEDPLLARELCRAGEGRYLPERLYDRVAELYRATSPPASTT